MKFHRIMFPSCERVWKLAEGTESTVIKTGHNKLVQVAIEDRTDCNNLFRCKSSTVSVWRQSVPRSIEKGRIRSSNYLRTIIQMHFLLR